MNEKDYVADIMNQWYDAMSKNKVMVQPKASTLLGTILAKYKIQPNNVSRDIWSEYLSLNGGDFQTWWSALSDADKKEWSIKKEEARLEYDNRSDKHLLKG